MDKMILVQYADMMEEIKDIRRRIRELEKYLSSPHQVSDTVKGTRKDGTIGSIKITGYPTPEYYRKKGILERYKQRLEQKEADLLELMTKAEEYIETIDKSELRIMFRLYYIDGLTWVQVANRMNVMFPKRKKGFSEDSCRMRNNRFFEKIL